MVGKSNKDNNKKSSEESAIGWPPADYREFVQTQIANRMMLWLGGIGVTTIIALSSAYIGLQSYFNASNKAELTEGVKQNILSQLPALIIKQLADQSQLVKNAEQDLRKQVDNISKSVLDSSSFQTELNDKVFKGLEKDEALQKIILAEAWQKAKTGTSDPTRSLGLQLYALFHGGQRTLLDQKKMRENFVELASAAEIPVQTMGTILKYYPMGEYGDTECKKNVSECEEYDRLMIVYTLKHLGSQNSYFDKISDDYLNILSKIPQNRQDEIVGFIKSKEGRSKATAILAAWARTEGREFRESAARIMIDFATGRDEELRMAGLRGLAEMGADANLYRGTRAHVLSQVLRNTSPSDKDLIFRRSYGNPPSRAGSGQSAADPRSSAAFEPEIKALPTERLIGERGRVVLIGTITTNMLRTALNDKNGKKVNDPKDDNDWVGVVMPLLQPGGDATLDGIILQAWIDRAALDVRQGLDVSWARGAMLDYMTDSLTKESSVRSVYAKAIQHAPRESVESFADRYFAVWKSGIPRDSDEVMQAILTRDAALDSVMGVGSSHKWLAKTLRTLDESSSSASVRNILLSEIIFGNTRWPQQNSAEWFDALAQRARKAFESPDASEAELSKLLVSQIEYFLNSRSGEIRWRMIESIEASNLLALSSETTKQIRGHLPWYGRSLDSTVETVEISSAGEQKLSVNPRGGEVQTSAERTGLWWKLVVASEHNVEIAPPNDGSSLVVFDSQRMVLRARSSGPGKTLILSGLGQGESAISLRGLTDQSINAPIRIVTSIGPLIVGPTTRAEPRDLARSQIMEFRTGVQAGELWLALSLEAGAELKLTTLRAGSKVELDPAIRRIIDEADLTQTQKTRLFASSEPRELRRRIASYGLMLSDDQMEQLIQSIGDDPDTLIRILDAESGSELAKDDDGGEGVFSDLTFTDTRTRRLLIGITDSDEKPFKPRDAFRINALITPKKLVTATATRQDAPAINIGELVFIAANSEKKWIRLSLPEPAVIAIRTIAFTELVDSAGLAIGTFSAASDRGESKQTVGLPKGVYFLSVAKFEGDSVRLKVESERDATFRHWGQTDEKETFRAGENAYFLARPGEYQTTISATTDHYLTIIFNSPEGMEIKSLFLRESSTGGERAVTVEESGALRFARFALSGGESYDVRVSIPDGRGLVSITTDKKGLPFDGFKRGDRVILGRHDLIDGQRNWSSTMDKYVGCIAQISRLAGKEADTVYVVSTDLKYAEPTDWKWRTINLRKARPSDAQPDRCRQYASE
jgi:hypothetical protein